MPMQNYSQFFLRNFSPATRLARRIATTGLALVVLPLGAHAVYYTQKDMPGAYWQADWSSTGRLPAPVAHKPAMVRIFAARTGRWKGIFAVHTWIVLKDRDAAAYHRFDKVGWGAPVRLNAYPPDARWYSNLYDTVYAVDGAEAERLIPQIRAAIAAYPYGESGDYRIWPGPNSNTFTACVIAAVPGMDAILPPTAIGKDFPCTGGMLERTPTGTGWRFTAGGYFSLSAGWSEGLELSFLGAVVGIDFRKPAIKLPGIGRIGMSAV